MYTVRREYAPGLTPFHCAPRPPAATLSARTPIHSLEELVCHKVRQPQPLFVNRLH
jgi:hypothetical protein